MSIKAKYRKYDKVRPMKGSFLYIIDDAYVDDEGSIIYITHAENSFNGAIIRKEFKEEDIVFAGFAGSKTS